ncbi:MAG: hypothetical protein ACREM1_17920 [Longimicrobiales bacterium]
MSSLSHEYASTSDFSWQINHAVLLLEKRYSRGESEGPSSEELAVARRLAQQTVRALRHRLGGQPIVNVDEESLPDDVVSRIEERQRGSLDSFTRDLAELDRRIASNVPLQRKDLALLDSICEAADASASATFRKLWRR